MLVPRFKNLCLVFSFIGCEKGVNIIEKYDRLSLYPLLYNETLSLFTPNGKF
jgi:hypothetical protein